MCMSSPSIPAPLPPPPPPPAPAETASKASPQVKAAKKQASDRARNLQGSKSTQLTGPRGLMAPANVGTATLLS